MLLMYFILIPIFCSCSSVHKNVILILTDDQDLLLDGLAPMKYTQNLLSNQGVTLQNAFVTSPICCPSRSSILTGQYVHNHGTKNNSISGGCANIQWQQSKETKTFATKLHDAGYRTFYAGKYLNQYGTKYAGGTKHIPKGWDWWYGLVGNSKYYNYTLSINGSAKYFQNEYLTDVIKKNALDFLNQKYVSNGGPFLMVLSTPAPHAPFIPAKRHEHLYPDIKLKKTPSFNYTVGKSKHWLLRMPPNPLPESAEIAMTKIQRLRWQTLAAVDEMIESLVSKLKLLKLLNNTYIMFTSDNGYHIGQFCQAWDKRQPYETDIRVPFLIRGPGLPKKFLSNFAVSNIDIAPTIIEMAGLKPAYQMDGESFLKPLIDMKINIKWSSLIEYHGERNIKTVSKKCPWSDSNLSECSEIFWCKCQDVSNNTYTCLRKIEVDQNLLYCEFVDNEDFIEVYNLNKDPYQLNNIAEQVPHSFHKTMQKNLNKLRNCKYKNCRL